MEKYYVRIIDENGLFVEDAFVNELTEYTIETPCPDGFYRPKWDGEKWVEGGTAPEPTPPEPTVEERLGTVENKTATLEETLEVLFS